MTELQLYKFLKTTGTEYELRGNALLVWIAAEDIRYFCNMAETAFEEYGINCTLTQYGDICFDLMPICKAYHINPKRILER